MIRISQLKLHICHTDDDLRNAVIKRLHIRSEDLISFSIARQAIDARDKDNIRYVYAIDADIRNEEKVLKQFSADRDIILSEPVIYELPEQGTEKLSERPCIIGAGPAGLFCAYYLARYGYRPLLIEQGSPVDERKAVVEAFLKDEQPIDPYTNIQFGEGGAGAFSDGKLTSGIKDQNGRKTAVLKTFVKFGAPAEILYSAKPHVGTDILRGVIKNIREAIISDGGSVLFNTRLTDIKCEDGSVKGITVLHNGEAEYIPCTELVLAAGNSSRELYRLMAELNIEMQAKPFAVGVRVQHSQDKINRSQYGDDYREKYANKLPPADYKLTARASDGHAVYSFCMCPGGYVINSSSEPGMLCVNGMSYSGRAGKNANAAIIVSISPEDIGAENDPLKAVEFQRELETNAYRAGSGRIPSQRLEDFIAGRKTRNIDDLVPQTKGYAESADLNSILPEFICRDIKEAFESFGKKIQGFDDPDALLSGVESRTSSPVRIVRGEDLQSVSVKGLYPCGEGSGYAGGITSSAVDGIRVFEKIYSLYRPY